MNHAIRSQNTLHTFARCSTLDHRTLVVHNVAGFDQWDPNSDQRVPRSRSPPKPDVMFRLPLSTFLAGLARFAAIAATEDIELLKRFAGAMGLEYTEISGT